MKHSRFDLAHSLKHSRTHPIYKNLSHGFYSGLLKLTYALLILFSVHTKHINMAFNIPNHSVCFLCFCIVKGLHLGILCEIAVKGVLWCASNVG